MIQRAAPGLTATAVRGEGEVGGGALPVTRLPGWVVALEDSGRNADELERLARGADPPVIGYIRDGTFRMDVRTLGDTDTDEAAHTIARAHQRAGGERE
jgi:L-seryl-tRNA(Ser) seleniumtransferase